MRLGRITGTVRATVKPSNLEGKTLMVVELTDATGKVTDPAVVAINTCGAGTGDSVLITFGSAARVSADTSGLAVDAAIIAVVDEVTHTSSQPPSKQTRGKK